MTEPTEPRPLKRNIPPDLQRQIEEIKKKVPRSTGTPNDLNDSRKRWLVVGICLHTIISPVLRTFVLPVVTKLCYSLTRLKKVHQQIYGSHLKRYAPTNTILNYEAINNNKTSFGRTKALYDYKIKSPVDLSKLFLQTHMAHFTAFDDSCDSSALLGIIVNIDRFPVVIQSDAKLLRSNIRNPWSHCDFTEWTATKYTDSFNLMRQLISNLKLSHTEENRILVELNRWASNGHAFLSGTRLGLEIVQEISGQTQILGEYVQTLCTETDNQFIRLQQEIKEVSRLHLEQIKNLEAEIKQKDEHHIPENIRAQHEQEINEWEQDESSFVCTRATQHILRSSISNGCIIVTGSSGCGKSSNIHHAALHLRYRSGYEIIPVLTGPSDIINYYNGNKKQAFVVDDICGKETINIQTLQTWRDYSEKMEKIFKSVDTKNDDAISEISGSKLLVSCRLHIYKESQFQLITFLTRKECNLLSTELCLLPDEQRLMMQNYLPDDIIGSIVQVMENVDFFPLLCKLSKDKTSEEVIKLFTAPVDSIQKNINHIIVTNTSQFYVLVLCVLFDDGFDTKWLKSNSAPEKKRGKIEAIVKEFEVDLSKETSMCHLKSCFSTLDGTYLKGRGTEYRMIHDKIYKMVAVICGQKLTECFINHAPSTFIRDYFIFKSISEMQTNDDLIKLSEDQELDYFERLLCDLKEFIITSTFHNKQLTYQSFIDKLIDTFKGNDEAKTLLKELDTEGCKVRKYDYKTSFNTTPLIESASGGYYDLVMFLICYVKCNVNKVDGSGRTPLYKASDGGKTHVVSLLLQNNANVSQGNNDGESPLYVACKRGHTDTVKILLLNNANVSQDTNYREFPLHEACQGGYTDIVNMLLQNKANANLSKNNGDFPMLLACRGGHTAVVKLLLQNSADVSQYCNSHETTSLLQACYKGHTDTVELLLKNNADISKSDVWGTTPLHDACDQGHSDIVKLLLQNQADTSLCNQWMMTPLFLACVKGHAFVVELLLQNNADVSKCDMYGESPLYVACTRGHTKTVKLLLQKNADVSQCRTYDGQSPLHVALSCVDPFSSGVNAYENHKKYTEIVRLLIASNADVSLCSKNGSPLDIARKSKSLEMIKLLEDNLKVRPS
ncbi:uncharacterized protein LOC134695295 [Mytilus trossulus]|uniref:uncharacterized protein LOC134695295 n=1 Tax=Mytilus trossulus TaxID=6551 RepID=UPI003004F07B